MTDPVVAVQERSDGDHVDGNAEETMECLFEVDEVEQGAVEFELAEEVDAD